jgi:hypothetical protein
VGVFARFVGEIIMPFGLWRRLFAAGLPAAVTIRVPARAQEVQAGD